MIKVFAVPGAAKSEPDGTWTFPVIAVVTPPTGVKVVPEGTITVWPAVTVSDWPGDSVVEVEFPTTRESDCVALVTGFDESVTVTENVVVPATVGVPESKPALLSVRPPGRVLPPATTQVYGGVPPKAVRA